MYNYFDLITVLEPLPNALVRRLRKYPHMHDEEYAQQRFGPAAAMGPLVLPHVNGENRRVIYTVTEYDPLLDSSNMTNMEWVRIAEDIQVKYTIYMQIYFILKHYKTIIELILL